MYEIRMKIKAGPSGLAVILLQKVNSLLGLLEGRETMSFSVPINSWYYYIEVTTSTAVDYSYILKKSLDQCALINQEKKIIVHFQID
jgi:hypothetical protein